MTEPTITDGTRENETHAHCNRRARELELQIDELKGSLTHHKKLYLDANRLNQELQNILRGCVENCLCVCGSESGKKCDLSKAEEYLKRVDPVQKLGHCHENHCTVDHCGCACDRCLRHRRTL